MVPEAIVHGELWICVFHMGNPGSMNYINVLGTSPWVTSILQGRILPEYRDEVAGRTRTGLFFLVDGIYPHWEIY